MRVLSHLTIDQRFEQAIFRSTCSAAMIMLMLAASPVCLAEDLSQIVQWGQTLARVQDSMAPRCMAERTFRQVPPALPLALSQEYRYLCLGYRSQLGMVDVIAFVFADDKLVQVEARGNAVSIFDSFQNPTEHLLGYIIRDAGQRVLDVPSDTVWFLSTDAGRVSMFVRSDQELDLMARQQYAPTAALPGMLQFGMSTDQALPQMRRSCPQLGVSRHPQIVPLEVPASPTKVICLGLVYAGFPRRLDAIFVEDALYLARVMTGKPEESRIRSRMIASFGPVSWRNDLYDVFAQDRVVLRKDQSEVLFLSEAAMSDYFPLLRQALPIKALESLPH